MSVAMAVCHLVMTSLLYTFHFYHYFCYRDVEGNKLFKKEKAERFLFHFHPLLCRYSDWPCCVLAAEQYNELELTRI